MLMILYTSKRAFGSQINRNIIEKFVLVGGSGCAIPTNDRKCYRTLNKRQFLAQQVVVNEKGDVAKGCSLKSTETSNELPTTCNQSYVKITVRA